MTVTENEIEDISAQRFYLEVGGMTCGACVRRVEKKLNAIEGVSTSVNLATRTATVDVSGSITANELCAAVQDAGYTAAERPDGEPAAAASPSAVGHLFVMLHQLIMLPVQLFRRLRALSR